PLNTVVNSITTFGNNIFIGTNNGVYYSIYKGANWISNGGGWNSVNTGIPANSYIANVVVDSSNICINTTINVYIQSLSNIISQAPVTGVTISPAKDTITVANSFQLTDTVFPVN